jgi:hypothetical protein
MEDFLKHIQEFLSRKEKSCEIQEMEHISIHATQGIFPEKLFKERAPYQSEKEFDYLKANYRTKSHPVWIRFIGANQRIWADQNWSLDVPDYANKEDNPFIYLYKNYPKFDSLEAYFRQVVSTEKHRDANAVLVVKPLEIPTKEVDGEHVIDDAVNIRPFCQIYNCDKIVVNEEHYFMALTSEKSIVQYGGREVKEGKVFEAYDLNYIYKIIQVGKKNEDKYEVQIYWQHDLGYLPCFTLKGIPKQEEKKITYSSYFTGALAPLDQVLLDNSYLTAIKAGHAFPQKWEYADECDYTTDNGSCVNGLVITEHGTETCPKCNGSGKKGSVFGTYKVKTPTSTDPTQVGIPPMGYVAPDPQILNFLQEQIDSNMMLAESILNIASSDSKVKGNETALGKQIDREELFSMLLLTSNQLFDLFQNAIKTITEMGYGVGTDYIQINAPRTFTIRTDLDITTEISVAKEKNLPLFVLVMLMKEYLQIRFNNSDYANRVLEIVFYVDRLAVMSNLEIAQQRLSNSVLNYEVILHTSIYNFIDEEIQKDKEFINKELPVIKDVLLQKAIAIDLQTKPKTNTDEFML